ncbi:MAG: ribosome silencing factor [Cyanobacteria bacterium J06648_11]
MLNPAIDTATNPPLDDRVASATQNDPDKNDPSYALALAAVEAADDRKAGNITWLNVAGVSILSDYFIIATGYSTTQVRAIATEIEDRIEAQFQRLPRHVEGRQAGTWILMDYEDAIVHVMLESEREFYNLEAFWGHAPRVQYSPQSASTQPHSNPTGIDNH